MSLKFLRPSCVFAGLAIATTTGAFGAPILVTTLGALSANSTATWNQLGADQTVLGATFSAVSSGGLPISGAFSNGAGSIVQAVCPAAPSCSWIPSGSGLNPGDRLIVTSNGTVGATGPLTLTFPAVFGAGMEVQIDFTGTYTAQIQAFNGLTSLATFTESSNTNGDPIFIGVKDTSADITKIVLSMTACSDVGCNLNDFGVDTLNLDAPTPEPSSLWLLVMTAVTAFCAWNLSRRRQNIGKGARAMRTFLGAGIAAALFGGFLTGVAQSQDLVGPLNVISDSQAVASLKQAGPVTGGIQPLLSPQLAIGLFSVVAYDGNTYQGEIVGRSPWARGLRTTSVNVVLIPIIVKTPSTSSGNFTSDPTSPDAGSPRRNKYRLESHAS